MAISDSSARPRRRLIAIVAVAFAAAIVVVGLALLAARDDAVEMTSAAAVAEPLPGRPPIVVAPAPGRPDDPAERVRWAEDLAALEPGPASALRLAAALIDADRSADAEAVLLAVGEGETATGASAAALALLQYDDADPEPALGTLRTLAANHPDDAFVRFSFGEALLWAGKRTEGEAELRRLRDAEPETFYGVAADDLIHPGMLSGYPPFVAATGSSDASLEDLATAAAARPDDAEAQIAHAAALLAVGRRAEAREAFDAALVADPSSIDAQVGVVMASFRKDDTASAFRSLGPLVRDYPEKVSPRLHLALVLLWLRQEEPARAELRQIVENAEPGPLRSAAERLLQSLSSN